MARYFAKPPLGSTLNWADPLADGLVLAYHMREGAGTTTADSANGKATRGTLVNQAAWINSEWGKALTFDGTTDYVTVPAFPAIIGDFSCAFVYKTSTTGRHLAGFYNLSGGFTGWGAGVGTGSAGRLGLWSSSGASGAWFNSTSTTHADGAWHVGVITLTGTSVAFYKDGAPDGTATVTTAPGARNATGALAGRSDGATAWLGQMAGAWVWRTTLTAKAVKDFSADPFRMFRRRRNTLFVQAAPAGGNRRRRVLLTGGR